MKYMLICFGLFSLAVAEPLTISRSDIQLDQLDSESAPPTLVQSTSNDKEKRGATKTQQEGAVPVQYTYTQPQFIHQQSDVIQPPPPDAYGTSIQAQNIQYIPPSQQTFVTPTPHQQPQTKYQYVKPTVSTIPQQQLFIAHPPPTQYVFLSQPSPHHHHHHAPVSSASSLSQYYVPSSHPLGLPLGYSMQPIIMMLIPSNHLTSSASGLQYFVAPPPRGLQYSSLPSYLLPPQHAAAAAQPVTYLLQPAVSQSGSSASAQQLSSGQNLKSQSQYNQVKGR